MVIYVIVAFAILFFVAIVTIYGIGYRDKRAFERTFSVLADNLKGVCSHTRHKHTVYFNERGVGFVVQGRGSGGTLQIYAAWPDTKFRVKFTPETLSDSMKQFIGMEDIKIGVPKFDKAFVIQSNDIPKLMSFVEPQVQSAIYSFGRQVSLSIAGGKILLERKIPLSDTRRIERYARQFAKAYFILHDVYLSLQDQVVTLEAVAVELEDALCMVCGEQIEDRKVHCRSCATPHHEECWVYLGQCSTYGCGQSRFRKSVTRIFIGDSN